MNASLRDHFRHRAAGVADFATVESEDLGGGGVRLRLRPRNPSSAAVILEVLRDDDVVLGVVRLDDQASVPVELGDDLVSDRRAIDDLVDLAVDGRATSFHSKRGGCLEERHPDGTVTRSWNNAVPTPGWRRRWLRVDYVPYR